VVCQKIGQRHSIFCALPPYVLRAIAQNGTEEQREAALKTLSIDTTHRTLRGIRLATPVSQALTSRVAVQGGKQRTIYDAHNTENLPGDLVRAEGAPTGDDPVVDEVYDNLGTTYDFYWSMLGRNSLDGQGGPLLASVHYSQNYDNAFWNGQFMVFGDGLVFDHLSELSVAAHELTHGVTEVEAQLIYHGQSGALNESISDVFASLVKQFKRGRQDAGDADWLIGEGIWADTIQGKALRSMSNPGSAFDDPLIGRDEQPAHMDNYFHGEEDNQGVHINSGICNKAFSLIATKIGGYAGEKAGPIWYTTLRDRRLRPDATFLDFAQLTYVTAWNLFPEGKESEIVRDAWREVGIEI
jgi:Zn-dependent metalloprotease